MPLKTKPSQRGTKWDNDWLQEKDNSGVLISKWCQQDRIEGKAYCRACSRSFSIMQHGISAIRQHADGQNHKIQISAIGQQKTMTSFFSVMNDDPAKQAVSSTTISEQAMAANLRFSLLVAQKDLSFNLMDQFTSLLPVAFPDSAIAQQFACCRTKTTYLVNEALAPFAKEQMFDLLRKSHFSIMLDEGTKRDRSYLAVLARVFSTEHQNVPIVMIGIKELTDSTAEGMKTVVKELLREGNIPVKHVLSVMTDSCNAMRGQNNGLLAKLKEELPHLIDVGGCSLHHVHNAVQYAVKALDTSGETEGLLDDVYNNFRFKSQRKAFHQIQTALNLTEHAFIRRVETRWLQVLIVVRRILEQWPALQQFFSNQQNIQNDRARRIREALTDKALARLQFLEQALPRCEKIEKLFQNESTQVHLLSSSLDDLCGCILTCFVREDVVNETNSLSDLADRAKERSNQLNNASLVIGGKTRETVDRLSPIDRIGFYKSVRDFYCELVQRLFSYLPLQNKILRALRFVDPNYLLGEDFNFDRTVLRVAKTMSTVIAVDELDELRLEVTRLRVSNSELEKSNPEKFWSCLPTATYPLLSKLGRSACCIPHGNADSERFLKWLANDLTKQRNKLSEFTLNSLLTIKTWLKANLATAHTVTIEPSLIAIGFEARSKAADRARLEQRQQAMKRLQKKMEEQRAIEAAAKKAQEEQQQQEEDLVTQQQTVDEMRRKAQEMLAAASKAEAAFRKRLKRQSVSSQPRGGNKIARIEGATAAGPSNK